MASLGSGTSKSYNQPGYNQMQEKLKHCFLMRHKTDFWFTIWLTRLVLKALGMKYDKFDRFKFLNREIPVLM